MGFNSLIIVIIKTMIAMIGYTIHGSLFWSVVDFIFSPIAVIKWLICHEITFEVIRQTFAFLGA
jgi:hypothetical protein